MLARIELLKTLRGQVVFKENESVKDWYEGSTWDDKCDEEKFFAMSKASTGLHARYKADVQSTEGERVRFWKNVLRLRVRAKTHRAKCLMHLRFRRAEGLPPMFELYPAKDQCVKYYDVVADRRKYNKAQRERKKSNKKKKQADKRHAASLEALALETLETHEWQPTTPTRDEWQPTTPTREPPQQDIVSSSDESDRPLRPTASSSSSWKPNPRSSFRG